MQFNVGNLMFALLFSIYPNNEQTHHLWVTLVLYCIFDDKQIFAIHKYCDRIVVNITKIYSLSVIRIDWTCNLNPHLSFLLYIFFFSHFYLEWKRCALHVSHTYIPQSFSNADSKHVSPLASPLVVEIYISVFMNARVCATVCHMP